MIIAGAAQAPTSNIRNATPEPILDSGPPILAEPRATSIAIDSAQDVDTGSGSVPPQDNANPIRVPKPGPSISRPVPVANSELVDVDNNTWIESRPDDEYPFPLPVTPIVAESMIEARMAPPAFKRARGANAKGSSNSKGRG